MQSRKRAFTIIEWSIVLIGVIIAVVAPIFGLLHQRGLALNKKNGLRLVCQRPVAQTLAEHAGLPGAPWGTLVVQKISQDTSGGFDGMVHELPPQLRGGAPRISDDTHICNAFIIRRPWHGNAGLEHRLSNGVGRRRVLQLSHEIRAHQVSGDR